MMNPNKYIGKQFRNWRVLEFVSRVQYGTYTAHRFVCVCACGFKDTITLSHLLYSRSKHCRKCIPQDMIGHRKADPQEVVELYSAGLRLYEIAQKFGVSTERVRQIVMAEKGTTRRQEYLDKMASYVPEVQALYKTGMTMTEIGQRLGISHLILAHYIHKYKIPLVRQSLTCCIKGCKNEVFVRRTCLCKKHYIHKRYHCNPKVRQKALGWMNTRRDSIATSKKDKCIVEGCKYMQASLGMCVRHYQKEYNKHYIRKRNGKSKDITPA